MAQLLLLKSVQKKSAQVESAQNHSKISIICLQQCVSLPCRSLFFLVIINFAVHCVWNDWTIGECSVTCGEGTRTNIRTHNETSQFGGDECDGSTLAIENCKDQECPGKKYPKQSST